MNNVLFIIKFLLLLGVSGVNCEEHSYGFQEISYIEFPPLDSQYNFIYLECATVQQNALLLYNHDDPSTSDFLALEIVSGRLWLSYDLGSGVIRLETGKVVADGSFHNITIRRNGNVRDSHTLLFFSLSNQSNHFCERFLRYFAGIHVFVSLRLPL